MRMSDFWWTITRLTIAVGLIVFAVLIDFKDSWMILQGVCFFAGVIFLGVFLLIMGDEVYPLFPLKYRILKKFKYRIFDEDTYEYLPQKQIFKFLIIPIWSAVSTESHTFKTQNIFGAKGEEYYSTDEYYKTEEEAKFSIDSHKKKSEREREEFFKRPEKKNIEIIKI